MSVVVRAALEADIDALVRLNQVVQSLHAVLYRGDFKPVIDPSAVSKLFATRLAAPESGIGVAESDGVPVGYVWYEVQARPETTFSPARRRVYVHNIVVAPDARRRGVATAMMSYVEQRAALAGIEEIALDTWASNLDARRFFGSQGFAEFNVMLRKKLP